MYLVCIYVFTIWCLYVCVYRYYKFYTRMYIFSSIARAIMCSVNLVKTILVFRFKKWAMLFHPIPIFSNHIKEQIGGEDWTFDFLID